jgi:hypothetical protein
MRNRSPRGVMELTDGALQAGSRPDLGRLSQKTSEEGDALAETELCKRFNCNPARGKSQGPQGQANS